MKTPTAAADTSSEPEALLSTPLRDLLGDLLRAHEGTIQAMRARDDCGPVTSALCDLRNRLSADMHSVNKMIMADEERAAASKVAA